MVESARELERGRLNRARRVAEALNEAYGVRRRSEPFSELAWDAEADDAAPVLHLEDVSSIPFVEEVPGVDEYQHRARVRARPGDVFAAVTDPAPGYETYNREVLGLGAVESVVADPVESAMSVAEACTSGRAYRRLLEIGRGRGGLFLHPYMAIEPVWRLARMLRDEGLETRVLGPPPPVLWIANDKARIAEINEELFDSAWNVRTVVERDPQGMARRLLDFATEHERVGLKRTRCASAMGNLVFESAAVREAGGRTVLRRVQRFLNRTEWEEGEEVLVVEWFDADHSPSTQTWIPPKSAGLPRLDGVYEQILESEERIFVGSRPSRLGREIESTIGEASLAVAVVLQELGYVGRCSFDFVVRSDGADYDARMIECNGRWGGTSTPMELVDRVVEGSRPPYIAQDIVDPDLVGAEFREIRNLLDEELYRPHDGSGRFVLYNPGPLPQHGKFDVISIGRDLDDARRGVEEILPARLGLDGS